MSGGSVPYHLRQNKAIERNLFVDLLVRINRVCPVSEYAYVGFGGPFLEDFKLVHSHFGNTQLLSLESEEDVYKRQKFNLPLGYLRPLKKSSGEFIDGYDLENNAIVWLDYASPRRVGDQVREFGDLLRKLRDFDVLKITLNANPRALSDDGANAVEKQDNRFRKLTARLAGNLPGSVTASDMTTARLPVALCEVLKYAATSALRGRNGKKFLPLTSYVYADSEHQMLTFAGIILPEENAETFYEDTMIDSWALATKSWGMPLSIDVPEMTIKERVFVDSRLHEKDETQIQDELSFCFDACRERSIAYIANYIKYYRYYPYFSKIVV